MSIVPDTEDFEAFIAVHGDTCDDWDTCPACIAIEAYETEVAEQAYHARVLEWQRKRVPRQPMSWQDLAHGREMHEDGHWADECPDTSTCGVGHWNPKYRRVGGVSTWHPGVPDESIASDNELSAATLAMLPYFDGDVARVRAEWFRVARSDDPGYPWTDSDFERHLGSRNRGALAKFQRRIAEADAYTQSWEAIAWALGTTLDEVGTRATQTDSVRQARGTRSRHNWEH